MSAAGRGGSLTVLKCGGSVAGGALTDVLTGGSASLVGGNGIALVLKTVGGLLQASCVLPSVLGKFGGIALVQGYIPFLQLGILNGINRELPYFIGKGDRQRVRELASAAQSQDPKQIAAIQQQIDKYLHLKAYGEFIQSPQVKLAQKLSELLPEGSIKHLAAICAFAVTADPWRH